MKSSSSTVQIRWPERVCRRELMVQACLSTRADGPSVFVDEAEGPSVFIDEHLEACSGRLGIQWYNVTNYQLTYQYPTPSLLALRMLQNPKLSRILLASGSLNCVGGAFFFSSSCVFTSPAFFAFNFAMSSAALASRSRFA